MKVKLPLYIMERTSVEDEHSKERFQSDGGTVVDAVLEILPEEVTMICPFLDKNYQLTEMTELAFLDGRVYVVNIPTGEFVKWYQDTFGEKFKEIKLKKKDE